jgi:hypothetical protein
LILNIWTDADPGAAESINQGNGGGTWAFGVQCNAAALTGECFHAPTGVNRGAAFDGSASNPSRIYNSSNFMTMTAGASGYALKDQTETNNWIVMTSGTALQLPAFTAGVMQTDGSGNVTAATAVNAPTSLSLSGKLALSSTAPTIANGGGLGTVGTITGSAAAFDVTAGTGAASVFVITLPSATNGWVCNGNDITTHSTTVSSIQQTVGTNNATTVTMGAYSDVSVLAAVGTADHLRISCIAY